MTNLTQQIVLKITPELDALLDKAFAKSVHETGNPPTRSDYIHNTLEINCKFELKTYSSTPNVYVKDPIINKVIWTLLCRIYQGSLEGQKPFRGLHLDEFITGARTEVEEVFKYLQDLELVVLDKDHNGFATIRLRTSSTIDLVSCHIEKLLDIARSNIIMSPEMKQFIDLLKLWNTPESKWSIGDICRITWHLPQAKNNISNNGFLLTESSNCIVGEFMKGMICDSPSEYARQLWDLPLLKSGEKRTDLYITYPDIYIGTK